MSDRLTQLIKLYAADQADPFLTYGIALEHGKLENFAEALTWLSKTIALDEHYCYAYFQQAKMHEEEGNTDAALAAIDLGIQKSKACGDAHAADELAELREMYQD
jgi:tetratricopeptide (TPR) repeat protein